MADGAHLLIATAADRAKPSTLSAPVAATRLRHTPRLASSVRAAIVLAYHGDEEGASEKGG
jgi:hypothetical protein